MSRRITFLVGFLVICLLATGAYVLRPHTTPSDKTSNKQTSRQAPVTTKPETSVEPFNTSRYSISDPTSPWVIVNKKKPINPVTYKPDDLVAPSVSLRIPGAEEMKLRKVAADNIVLLFRAAEADGINLQITTAYRGYSYQNTLYTGYVARQGQEAADTMSARPGYSEHQTGLAADIRSKDLPNQCYLEICFGGMKEGIWLARNAHSYGFIVRYPEEKSNITGYQYEPWHIRYVGNELATEMHQKNIQTLEEFFNTGAAADYE